MKDKTWVIRPIGVIHTPYKVMGDAPHQGRFSEEICEIEIFREYEKGLKDIETCSHLIVLYWLDRSDRSVLQGCTPHDSEIHGVFATRSPNRPNPIGFSVVELVEKEKNVLKVRGLDALDNSPLLDIKPYSSELDAILGAKIGWYERTM